MNTQIKTICCTTKAALFLFVVFLSHAQAQQSVYLYDPPGNLTNITQSVASAPAFAVQPSSQIISQNGTVYFSFVAAGPG